MNGRFKVPDSRAKVGNLWMFLEGQKIMEQMVTPDEQRALLSSTVATLDSGVIVDIAGRVEEYLADQEVEGWTMALVSGPDAQEAMTQRDRRVAEFIRRDVAERLEPGAAFSMDVDAAVASFRTREDLPVVSEQRAPLAAALAAWCAGDEADIEVEAADRPRLEAGLVAAMDDGLLRADEAETALNRVLDPEVVEEDPEAVADMADSLLQLLSEERDLQADPWLLRNLRGDLFELTDESTPVDAVGDGAVSATFRPTGLPRIYRELDQSLVTSQIQSLFIALLIVFVLLSLQFKSIAAGLLGCVPISFTVLLNFATMAWTGVALDITTVLIASLAIGIGVAAGFLTLTAASLVPLQNFGWMTAVTMLVSALAALVVISTVIMSLRYSRFLGRSTRTDATPGKS